MTGALCPIGLSLQIEWIMAAQQVKPPAGMKVTPDRATVEAIQQQRGDEYYRALEEYKKHWAACLACKKG